MGHYLFEETQKFKQIWLWVILVGVSLLMIIQVPLSIIHDAGQEQLSVSDIVTIIFSVAFVIGINALFFYTRLLTKIDASGITIVFRPFVNKPLTIPWAEVKKAWVRTYQPVWEYGGWGVRYRWNSRAYNVSGNKGLQLILQSGKKILIGTQRSEELENFLKKYIYEDKNIRLQH